MEPARVKWFDKDKGFGFANIFGCPDDVFIHMEALRRSGLADLQPGEAVAIRAIEGKRGPMAVAISPWENALRNMKRFGDVYDPVANGADERIHSISHDAHTHSRYISVQPETALRRISSN